MKNSTINKVVALIIMLFMIPVNFVEAKGLIDTNKVSSISINHVYKQNPIKDTKFSLFRVAEVSENEKYTLAGDFKDYKVDNNILNNSTNWSDISGSVNEYIIKNKISPQATGYTNSNGKVKFSNLKPGLYFVIGDKHLTKYGEIKVSPFLMSIPTLDKSNNAWVYDIDVNIKSEVGPKPDPDPDPDPEVDPNPDPDPEVDPNPDPDPEVDPNPDPDPEVDPNPDVDPEVDEELDTDPEEKPDPDVKPETDVKPESDKKPSTDSDSDKDKLPQTGMLFWPIGMLALLGTILMTLGYLSRTKNEK